jgi:hypothetical protein
MLYKQLHEIYFIQNVIITLACSNNTDYDIYKNNGRNNGRVRYT